VDVVDDVDDTGAVMAELDDARRTALADSSPRPAERVLRFIELGLWEEAQDALRDSRPLSGDLLTAEAELRFRQHRYHEAAARVSAVLARDRDNRRATLLQARLQIQAWNLDGATRTARALLDHDARDEAAALLVGRVDLLAKRFADALQWAERVQEWNPNNAEAFLLEAEVRFWDQDPSAAEAPLRQALAIDPFSADARFSYGYAIWRRVDATQLNAMAAHWEIALSIDPLHYLTHWHWGNGHTNLTYADYAHPTDSLVRTRLVPADSLIAQNRIPAAIALTRDVETEFPESVLPAMMRASAYYMAYDMARELRLDSAQATFERILARQRHYGPAHNGLAAVIKQRQFVQLLSYDSLEAEVAATPTPTDATFHRIFPDAARYPGDRVDKMIWQQMGPSRAYLPMLARFDIQFAIPPLHEDLADAMDRPSFRTSTTFDNRQWMDIRGVGSGATGIEYVERGAHWERNVLAHEYTHLFHGRVFTDEENRRTRALYYTAMEEGRTLDYYASNNESEFLAQAYPAYLAPIKAHPLNHKSMNTRDDLRRKDPETFAFVESLMEGQQAYLDGDSTALASNWAEVFTLLAEDARRNATADSTSAVSRAAALLDTALIWDGGYLPTYLSYAALWRQVGQFERAATWIARAHTRDSAYAPIFVARAELAAAQARAGALSEPEAFDAQVDQYTRALALERDYAVRADLNRTLREVYRDHGRYADAIRVAQEYVSDGPTVSTYLRDRIDDAAAFAHELRSDLGYSEETLPFFARLVSLKPQHYGFRGAYADALADAGQLREAIAVLEAAQRILRAAGRPSRAYVVQVADYQLRMGDTTQARTTLESVPRGRLGDGLTDDRRLVRLQASLGNAEAAQQWIADTDSSEARLPAERADIAFTRAWITAARGDHLTAISAYRAALDADPHHRGARTALIASLADTGDRRDARRVREAAAQLQPPMGPDFVRDARRAENPR
jgi:hypothetical protein